MSEPSSEPLPKSSNLDDLCEVLSKCKSLGILTGAGLSAGSGIPTYRGVGGHWKTTDPQDVASLKAWNENPGRVWSFFHPRRDQILKASPNDAHLALASLSIPSVRKRLLPSLVDQSKPPLYITQNIDGLCRRSIEETLRQTGAEEMDEDDKKAAQERHLEMHGNVNRTICTQCKCIKWTEETPLAPIFAEANLPLGEGQDINIPVESLPRCGGPTWSGSNRYGRCGGLLRPGAVWFGEVPENQGEIIRLLTKVDVLLVIGTSSLVQPASSYAGTVKKNGGHVALFNLGPSQGDDTADFVVYGPCEETIPKTLVRLGELNDQKNA
ncbi:hypothetical protein H1R20_g4466, partial [Candolleomyces eurysporus]